MTTQKTNDYSLFTGCLVPSKFPFIELASRKVLEGFGITVHAIDGASCCPNQMAIQSSDKSMWYALAARNLALAEKNGCDIVSLCNGCYDTLKSVNTRLRGDHGFRAEVNGLLSDTFGLEFSGNIDVKHLVQVLHDDIGQNAIEKTVVYQLRGLKCAPFPGCHSRRPMDHMGFDDPVAPHYLKELIAALGGDVVAFTETDSCCGGGLSIGRKEDVAQAARRVLTSALDAGADAVVVNCPFCFAQLFRSQREINDVFLDGMNVPVLYITQLMGLAMGFGPEELGMHLHYRLGSGAEERIVTWIREGSLSTAQDVFDEDVSREQLDICASCLACTDDCSTAMTTSEYRPGEILDLVLQGRADEVLSRDDIWFCMNCHECVEKCPQRFGMVKLIVRLKNLAVARGIYPEVIGHRVSELHDSGYSFVPDTEERRALGLPDITSPDMARLRRLLEKDRDSDDDSRGE